MSVGSDTFLAALEANTRRRLYVLKRRPKAARSGRSKAEIVRDAIRTAVLKPSGGGFVAICDGEPKRASIGHDSVHDER